MANPQEKLVPLSESSPLVDTSSIGDYEEQVTSSCCVCFPGIFIRRQRNNGNTHRHQLPKQEEVTKDSWLVEKAKNLKQISEVLAGPRWKNFIRRFNVHGLNKKRRMQYQYDPQSYALNFDDGIIDWEVDVVHPNFLPRYAGPVGMNEGHLGHD